MCDGDARWSNVEACAGGCEAGACLAPAECTEGALRCDGLRPQRCTDGAWEAAAEACSFGCDDGVCTGACSEGAARCWDEVVQRCDEQGAWQNEESCPFLCVDGACAGECAEGELRCDGLQVERCASGSWRANEEACAFGCTAGACTGVCKTGELLCEGHALRQCDENGAWRTSEDCAFSCVDGACTGECVPGVLQCAGDAVQICDERAAWQTVQICTSGCDGGACVSVCTEGARQCYGNVLQHCDAGGQWANAEACALGCSEGVCHTCTPGETACSGAGVATCEAPGFWGAATQCPSGSCFDGACVDLPPSCAPGGAGMTDCGLSGGDNCCASALIPGGAFLQDNDARYPATISSFRLDTYEITVGRFRQFVEAMRNGWSPQPGDGKHVHLRGGLGLVERGTPGSTEGGWDPAWSALLPADWNAAFASAFGCNWTDEPEHDENKAMNCIHWHEAYAFCIWDGGFLPSEAEWNYAAAGGAEQRLYPWGAADPESGDYAMHSGACPSGWCMAPDLVGSMPLGSARWGALDMAANAGEWVLDWYEDPYPAGAPCADCTNLVSPRTMRGLRGGAHWDPPNEMISTEYRYYGTPDFRVIGAGARCARVP